MKISITTQPSLPLTHYYSSRRGRGGLFSVFSMLSVFFCFRVFISSILLSPRPNPSEACPRPLPRSPPTRRQAFSVRPNTLPPLSTPAPDLDSNGTRRPVRQNKA